MKNQMQRWLLAVTLVMAAGCVQEATVAGEEEAPISNDALLRDLDDEARERLCGEYGPKTCHDEEGQEIELLTRSGDVKSCASSLSTASPDCDTSVGDYRSCQNAIDACDLDLFLACLQRVVAECKGAPGITPDSQTDPDPPTNEGCTRDEDCGSAQGNPWYCERGSCAPSCLLNSPLCPDGASCGTRPSGKAGYVCLEDQTGSNVDPGSSSGDIEILSVRVEPSVVEVAELGTADQYFTFTIDTNVTPEVAERLRVELYLADEPRQAFIERSVAQGSTLIVSVAKKWLEDLEPGTYNLLIGLEHDTFSIYERDVATITITP